MKYKIIWSKIARKDYKNIVEYLLNNWGRKEAENFIISVEKNFDNLSTFPNMGVTFKDTDFRRLLILRKISIYYKVSGNEIIIYTLWVSKRNPLELEKFLS